MCGGVTPTLTPRPRPTEPVFPNPSPCQFADYQELTHEETMCFAHSMDRKPHAYAPEYQDVNASRSVRVSWRVQWTLNPYHILGIPKIFSVVNVLKPKELIPEMLGVLKNKCTKYLTNGNQCPYICPTQNKTTTQ